MSANTERLERLAQYHEKKAESDARSFGDLVLRMPELAAQVERNRNDAAFLRSLNPLVEAGERAQWQPIETAPKDGTKVLLYKPHDDFGCSSIATARWWEKEREWICTGSAYFPAPTHWQPLPPEPKGGA